MMNYGDPNASSNYASSGGGFLTGENTQGYQNTQPSPNKSSGQNRESQTILPITLKQLRQVKADPNDENLLLLDGQPLSVVKVIGLIMSMSHHSTYINMQVNDGTGQTDVRLFVHGQEDQGQGEEGPHAALVEGTYVRIVGNVREFQEQKNISGFSAQPVTDMNQLTHHFLNCIYMHLQRTRGIVGGNAHTQKNITSGSSYTTPLKSDTNASNYNSLRTPTQELRTLQFNSTNNGPGEENGSGFTGHQTLVLNALGATSECDTGVNIDTVMSTLRGQMSHQEIGSALNYLINEGHVYSTIDENHFKRTE